MVHVGTVVQENLYTPGIALSGSKMKWGLERGREGGRERRVGGG